MVELEGAIEGVVAIVVVEGQSGGSKIYKVLLAN